MNGPLPLLKGIMITPLEANQIPMPLPPVEAKTYYSQYAGHTIQLDPGVLAHNGNVLDYVGTVIVRFHKNQYTTTDPIEQKHLDKLTADGLLWTSEQYRKATIPLEERLALAESESQRQIAERNRLQERLEALEAKLAKQGK